MKLSNLLKFIVPTVRIREGSASAMVRCFHGFEKTDWNRVYPFAERSSANGTMKAIKTGGAQ